MTQEGYQEVNSSWMLLNYLERLNKVKLWWVKLKIHNFSIIKYGIKRVM